jgi:ClpP class serine protease
MVACTQVICQGVRWTSQSAIQLRLHSELGRVETAAVHMAEDAASELDVAVDGGSAEGEDG